MSSDIGSFLVLVVENLEVVYADVIVGLRGMSLEVPDGSVVCLLGANGAGKTTCLRAIGGLLGVHDGKITKGTITFEGKSIKGWDGSAVVRAGIAQVLEGRRIFAELTIDDNLRAGAFVRRDSSGVRKTMNRVFELFPILAERRGQTAGYLSGGEQQMLAIGRALMASPKLLLLDEPSLGLAPMIVSVIRDAIVEINAQGTSVLLVEQNAAMALQISSYGYVLENGRIVMEKTGEALAADPDIGEFYLGLQEGARRSYRDVKHYRRKKRWLS